MNIIAMRKTRRLVILLLAFSALAGCAGKAVPPLSLAVTSQPLSLEEEITLTLANPGKSSLFVPVDWAGIEMFRQDANGNWVEYKNPKKIVPMLNTAESQLVYSIPAGTLVPGTYKMVIRGRVGQKGAPFNLETNLDLSSFSSSDIQGS
ncbi:MAG: hypothetical protein PHS56_05005 [Eubacteriales bacterium]|nr:hypothetical protein [Eubacteriales bacterium]